MFVANTQMKFIRRNVVSNAKHVVFICTKPRRQFSRKTMKDKQSVMCQEHTGCHNENTDACPELIKRLKKRI